MQGSCCQRSCAEQRAKLVDTKSSNLGLAPLHLIKQDAFVNCAENDYGRYVRRQGYKSQRERESKRHILHADLLYHLWKEGP